MNRISLIRRLTALFLGALLLVAQGCIPALALESWEMPSVTVTYEAGGASGSSWATCVEYGGSPAYWATLPGNADLSTLQAWADGSDEPTSFGGVWADDFSGMPSVYLDLYANGEYIGAYPLFLSTREAPQEESEPATATVSIQYVDSSTGAV